MDAAATCEQCDEVGVCPCCESSPALRVDVLRKPTNILRRFSRTPTPTRSIAEAAKEEQQARTLRAAKIDFHQHCTVGDDNGLASLLSSNAACRVERAVLLALRTPGGSAADARRANDWTLAAAARHKTLVPFVTVVEDDPEAVEMLRDGIARGACGVKLIGWAGKFIAAHDYDMRAESLMAVYRLAAAHGLPVLAHVALGYASDGERADDSSCDKSSGNSGCSSGCSSGGGGGFGAAASTNGGDAGGCAAARDYLSDIDAIMHAVPGLTFILAHFGLGCHTWIEAACPTSGSADPCADPCVAVASTRARYPRCTLCSPGTRRGCSSTRRSTAVRAERA